MPTYEYVCEKCEHKFEEFQNMSDEPIKLCPKCSGDVRRLIGSGAGIIFKGSGFYETDYKRKKPAPAACSKEKTDSGRDAPCDTPSCSKKDHEKK